MFDYEENNLVSEREISLSLIESTNHKNKYKIVCFRIILIFSWFSVLSIYSTNGLGWCLPMLGLTSSYQPAGQNWNSSATVTITGSPIPLGVWTHLVTSYSATNGIRLWVNGTLIGSSGTFAYAPSTVPNTITLGNSLLGINGCAAGPIVKGQFYGMMDELRVCSRELNSSDVYTLANP